MKIFRMFYRRLEYGAGVLLMDHPPLCLLNLIELQKEKYTTHPHADIHNILQNKAPKR